MKILKNLIMLLGVVVTSACGHYASVDRPESQNIINAPINVVWDNTPKILPTERIDIDQADKSTYTVVGRKRINMWTMGDDVRIRLIPRGENQTVVDFEATTPVQVIGWGHAERMVESIFEKIKTVSEAH
jgi:hypothetical protein